MSKFINRATVVAMLRQKEMQCIEERTEPDAEGTYYNESAAAYGRAALLVETFNDLEADELEAAAKCFGPVINRYFQ